ncbi:MULTISPECIES: methyl-accepting chemotaxis protein [unclassified Caballeronia]|uniref:methyl-accepting chemotaxis protein n=1 Tax=unclassified Caballeronia TaxID=2646786 RepID=UPI001F31D5D4|nr:MULTISPECIES: methyl-accepting chemotaxis protein [unclassified Caballeronia]MCE4544860.1 methyl-accepting chemotaxis protein [Caballeronia sp. PC1]MCE4570285.1 methyl-accepting chemotaxis protein [Caballeronia sp. CLC5]
MSQFFSSIKSRIILVLTASMLITILVGGAGLYGMSSLSGSMQETYRGNIVPITRVAKVRAAMMNMRLALWRMQAQQIKDLVPKVREFQSQMDSDWKSYYTGGDITSPSEQAIADKINALIPRFEAAVAQELPFIEAGDFAAAGRLQTETVFPMGNELSDLIGDDFENNADQARDASAAGEAQAARLTWINLTLILIGATFLTASTVYLVRVITVPLNNTVRIASDISEGRLDSRIVAKAQGEFGRLLDAMKTMSENLAGTVRGIRDSSESVNVAAAQIAAGNQDLSARTEEQASSLEQTAASMTQLTETVRQNADNARQANSLANNAREMTDAGSAAVESMVATIKDISADSSQIAEITGMIEGIAFQTNILALNAAVEAARAGEQGRGFAVVAGEVRTLAQRASVAAKEIKELIEASAKKVHRGAEQAGVVSANMDQVSHAIGRVSDIVGEITAASDEQSKGIEQVHAAITQIDEVTQQNAALVEEAAAAAQSLQEQADRMKSDMGFFRLDGDVSAITRKAPVPSPVRKLPTASSIVKPRKAMSSASTKAIDPSASAPAPADESEWQTF